MGWVWAGISWLLAESRDLSQTGDYHFLGTLTPGVEGGNSPAEGWGAKMGGEGRRGHSQRLRGAISRVPEKGTWCGGCLAPRSMRARVCRASGAVGCPPSPLPLWVPGAGSTLSTCTDVP